MKTLRLKSFDALQQVVPRTDSSQSVIIVDIDDYSLSQVGQWPWPRSKIGRIVQNLKAAGAAAIAFDAVFSEPDRLSPPEYAVQTEGLGPELRQELSQLPSNERLFADAMAGSSVILGQAGTQIAVEDQRGSPRAPPTTFIGGDPRYHFPAYLGLIRNLPVLESAAGGIGMFTVEPDSDGIIRRMQTMVRVNDHVLPSLTMEVLRLVTSADGYVVRALPHDAGVESVGVGAFTVPTDATGQMWINYAPAEPGMYLPAAFVLRNDFDRRLVRDRIVLIGASASGLGDIRATPFSPAVPGVEVHAHVLETILSGAFLVRPGFADSVELAIAAILALTLIAILPALGAQANAAVLLGTVTVIIAGSWYFYSQQGWILDPSFALACVILTLALLTYFRFFGTERRQRQAERARAFQETLLDTIGSPVFYKRPNGVLLGCNRAFREMHELEPGQMNGKTIAQLMPLDYAKVYDQADEDLLRGGETVSCECQIADATGAVRDMIMTKAAFCDPDGGVAGIIGIMADITERKKLERDLRKLATTDALTGVYSRRTFLEMAEAEIARVQRYRRPLSLLLIDIDHFKAINDTHGHVAGDEALRHFAMCGLAHLRTTDVMGRLGGEEFGVLLPETSSDMALQLAERLRKQLSRIQVSSATGPFCFTVSIGVHEICDGRRGVEEYLNIADQALYQAKARGRNCVVQSGERMAEMPEKGTERVLPASE